MTDQSRRILLGILLLGVIGLSAELLLLSHTEDASQWIPLVLNDAVVVMSAVVVMANADYSGGVLDTIQEAVLAKMMPAANAPKIAGSPAREAALDMLRQIRSGTVDRSMLSAEYSAFLTPARLAAMSKSLTDAGEISQVETGSIGERGGLEVSTLRMLAGTTPISTLMYRAPDGKIEEFLFSRR